MAITSASAPDAAPRKQTLSGNYIDFTGAGSAWAQQYLPDLMEKEAEIFGKRTVAGFLSQVGAEEASNSDRVVWSEQGRLHLSYKATYTSINILTITKDIDGNALTTNSGIRVGDTVVVTSSVGNTAKCHVQAVDDSNNQITMYPYGAADLATAIGTTGTADILRVLVYGSEHAKGTAAKAEANQPTFKSHFNKHIILKDFYEISGSDAGNIGWVEVSGEDGQSGYLWYLKAECDTRARFTDYMEMALLEGELAVAGSVVENTSMGLSASTTGYDAGTEGLFKAIENRGHQTTGITGVNASTDLAEFDAVLAVFDQNGAVEENMLFVNRSASLAIDDMLASMNSYGAGGTSYGVFNNSEDMALNLGFSGFRRGSYDFYKSDMKYLNDQALRGGLNDTVNAIRGVVVPAGVSSVYDEQLGKNIKRPFLHVRYKTSEADDRKLKTWVTGSVGATTSGKDVMEVHYLSERCLITQGANNFMLMN
jgi:hypothetical protein